MGVNAYAALVAPRTLRRPYMAPSCSFLYTLSPAYRPHLPAACRLQRSYNCSCRAALQHVLHHFTARLVHAQSARQGRQVLINAQPLDGWSQSAYTVLEGICAASACCYRPHMQHAALSVPLVHAATDPTCSAGSAGAAHSHAALPATPPACLHLGEAGNMYAQPCLLQTLHDISACMCISCHAASPTYGSCIAAFAACEWWTTSE
jgi:hypothetical protein